MTTIGRSTYAGFRVVIKAVATGPRGSRDLTFDEAREATHALLDGDVTPAQAGAFLIGLRVKGEAADELAGIAQALRDRAAPLRTTGPAPLVSAGAFDGLAEAPALSLAAACTAAAAGVPTVVACGTRLGPKHGVTSADVLAALGGPERPTPEQSERMLDRAGVALVHVGEALPGWEQLAVTRDEVGLRGPIHSAEKLVDWFGAKRFVVGHTHGGYAAKLLGALTRLEADAAIAVRGIEGSDVLRPGRPVAVHSATGPVELPETLGLVLRGDPDVSADTTRAVLAGDADGAARRAVEISAAVKLLAAGRAGDAGQALRHAAAALDDGRAAETLDALVG